MGEMSISNSSFFVDYQIFFDYMNIMPTDNPKVLITLDKKLLEKIEDFRYGNRIPTRSEAVRRLIEEGLKKHQKNPPKPSK